MTGYVLMMSVCLSFV